MYCSTVKLATKDDYSNFLFQEEQLLVSGERTCTPSTGKLSQEGLPRNSVV